MMVVAARALAAAGLVTAFGHVSVRMGSGEGRNSFRMPRSLWAP